MRQVPQAPGSRPESGQRFVLAARTWTFVCFVLLYALPGLIGHEPWKQDETYIAEIVRSMSATGDLVVPTMAGETFMEKPPLYYWAAAAIAKCLAPILPLADGARLASGLFVLLACAAVARCGRRWRGPEFGRTAVFVLLACLGLEAYAHLMLTDLALLAGVAIGLAGLPRWQQRPVASGCEIGTGVGIGFLAKGLLAPGIFALTALLLPLVFSRWRRQAYLRTVLAALAAALPWLLIWPAVLYVRSPALFADWFWLNNIGRFVGFSVPELGAPHDDGFWLRNLWWITLPAVPLALLSLWRERQALRTKELLQACVLMSIVVLVVLVFSASARGGYALPLLIPLSLLGAASAVSLGPRAERVWRWSGQLVFGSIAALVWLAWGYIMFSNNPLHLDAVYAQLAPSPDRRLHAAALAGCAVATVAALALMFWRKPRQAALQTWAVGLALCWLLLAGLFVPWGDQVKSYRQVFASMRPALPSSAGCIASEGLQESERAMLRYYEGVTTQRLELLPRADCRLLLVEDARGQTPHRVDSRTWVVIWEGARPADDQERFRLYRRRP
ncbi:ArnT family glycosyltransferase [Massilia sp. LXY-6]|uniref:ArnT family glycosyltransferase n=1 Tax=Massilia sp. LXY-6 TaxID=3379823 RepID=UPI003EE3E104